MDLKPHTPLQTATVGLCEIQTHELKNHLDFSLDLFLCPPLVIQDYESETLIKMLTDVPGSCTVNASKEIPAWGVNDDRQRLHRFTSSSVSAETSPAACPPAGEVKICPEMPSQMYNYQCGYSLLDLILLHSSFHATSSFHFTESPMHGLFLELVSLE